MVPCIPFGFRKYSFEDSTIKNLCDLDQITLVSQNTMPSSVNQVKEHLPQRLEGTKKDNVYKGLVISTQRLSKEGGNSRHSMLNTHLQTPQKTNKKPNSPNPLNSSFRKSHSRKANTAFLIYKLNLVRIFGEAVYLGQASKDAAAHP